MKRREFMKKTAVGVAGAGLLHTLPACAKNTRPNIVFIMTDQQSATMMSCTGNKWLETPALDGLAESGVRFERAYTTNPICVPSRFSLQTGLMPSAIGMSFNHDDKSAIVTDDMIENSLGSLFQNAGYETVYGGKIHLPHKMLDVKKDGKEINPFQVEDVNKIGYQKFLTKGARQGLADACVEYIKSDHEKPFLLFASFINPHDICYHAINEFRSKTGLPPDGNPDRQEFEKVFAEALEYDDIDEFVEKHCPPLPDNFAIPEDEPEAIQKKYVDISEFKPYIRKNWTETEWRLHRWVYAWLTEEVDKKIGQVIDAVKEAGLEDNTLIIFTSDHGDMDSAHQLEHKAVLYEESIRIPLILSYKNRIKSGVVDEKHLVSNGLDLLPTMLDFAVIPVLSGKLGKSLKPLATGEDKVDWRESLLVESHNSRMVRTDQYKYSIYDSGKNHKQLVDLKNDPGEMNNLAKKAEYQDVLEQHHQLLKEWIEKNGDTIGAKYVD